MVSVAVQASGSHQTSEAFAVSFRPSVAWLVSTIVALTPLTPANGQQVAQASRPTTALKIPTPEPHGLDASQSGNSISPVIALAVDGYKHIRRDIRDYTCIMVRRERIDGRLGKHEFIAAKVRHRRYRNGQVVIPFGVYLRFLKPTDVKGREVLYVEGQNNGEMHVRRGGQRFAYVTASIDPYGELAMRDNRYPITEFGFENLLRRLVQVARKELSTDDCRVAYHPGARVDGRSCTGISVIRTQWDPNSRFYEARVFYDDELRIPIHYEAYDWPENEGEEPVLLEQYTYMKVRLNPGLSDSDFDPNNPEYQLKN